MMKSSLLLLLTLCTSIHAFAPLNVNTNKRISTTSIFGWGNSPTRNLRDEEFADRGDDGADSSYETLEDDNLFKSSRSGSASKKGERKKLGERSSSDREAAFRAERAKMYEFAATTGLLDKMKQEAEDRDKMIEEGEYDDALDSGFTSDVYDEGDDLDVRVDFSEDDDKKKL
mmetsp:Transcript_30606/g.40673  ORF Transcript_30606/g.40673 Transcript_30606/m.40673 type:complete len:172 (+) Transcript_30606:96-611(+)